LNTDAVINVVDDDPAVARAISVVAKSLGYRVALYRSAEDFLYGHDDSQPGCILLDVKMPGMSGLELQQMLRRADVQLPIIMMSGHGDIPMAVEAMAHGAVTFLEKPFRMQALSTEISRAIEIDADHRCRREKTTAARRKLDALTEKERIVLREVVKGRTNRQIAEQFGLSVRAIEDRRSRVMKKLDATSVVALAELISLIPEEMLDATAE